MKGTMLTHGLIAGFLIAITMFVGLNQQSQEETPQFSQWVGYLISPTIGMEDLAAMYATGTFVSNPAVGLMVGSILVRRTGRQREAQGLVGFRRGIQIGHRHDDVIKGPAAAHGAPPLQRRGYRSEGNRAIVRSQDQAPLPG